MLTPQGPVGGGRDMRVSPPPCGEELEVGVVLSGSDTGKRNHPHP
ncbi:hypothetical protein EKPJFOCH_0404 [Methylobacterium thuringiense]|uniref:Uncharacterized protein n=1 Tax=Methylobacterium thuringiense TaxID=1003091 RepID=A0ABQ4TGM0_9HYPH|nr:hypothetical protein EKPJFOCH_0404 [Methylobacterium thuringiense]